MTDFDDLLEQIPIDQIARRLGVDRDDAERAVTAALPALVGGMGANAKDPAGASSLKRAVRSKDPGLVEGGVDLDDVDTEDGKKIVRNVFGANADSVVSKLGETGKADPSLISKVLPMLAPIVLAFLAKKMGGQAEAEKPDDESAGGIDIGGVLGDLLGGLTGSGGGGGGIDIGGLLGGLLGGGKR